MRSQAFNPGPTRTPLLSAACAALVLVPLLSFAVAFKGAFGTLYGSWFYGYLAAITVTRWVAAWALWRLHRWGAFLAWTSLAVDFGFTWFLGELNLIGSLIPVGVGVLIAIDFRELGKPPRNWAE